MSTWLVVGLAWLGLSTWLGLLWPSVWPARHMVVWLAVSTGSVNTPLHNPHPLIHLIMQAVLKMSLKTNQSI